MLLDDEPAVREPELPLFEEVEGFEEGEPVLAVDALWCGLAHGCGDDARWNSASAFHVGSDGASARRRAKRCTISPSCTEPLRSKSGRYSSDGW